LDVHYQDSVIVSFVKLVAKPYAKYLPTYAYSLCCMPKCF